jgi:hypothetical protein
VYAVEAADATKLGQTARWLLLICTLFGLAAMHTLGHASMPMDTHADHAGVSSADAGPTAAGTVMTAPCPDGHCGGGHGMDAWSVCLAILGGLALVVLIGALLSRRSRSTGPHKRISAGPPAARAPPGRRYQGLRVASLAVLRI